MDNFTMRGYEIHTEAKKNRKNIVEWCGEQISLKIKETVVE